MLRRLIKKTSVGLFCLVVFLWSTQGEIFAQSNNATIGEATSDFTLMPMFVKGSSGLPYEQLLDAMIIDQGYEAHCATYQWSIDKSLLGAIEKFFSSSVPPEESFYHGLNPTIFAGTAPYIVDLTRARIPMFRGLEDKDITLKNSSLEGMFGANFQSVQNAYMLNASGVTKRLLTSYQQCLVKAQNLIAIKQICKETTDPCTINKSYKFDIAVNEEGGSRAISDLDRNNIKADEHIENVSFNMVDLLQWFQNIRPGLNEDELYSKVCEDITGGDTSTASSTDDPSSADVTEIAKLREAINRIPIDLDTLYRLAFLVLVPIQDPTQDVDKFYFLQNDPQIDMRVHAPIFIAFKIPDFATNKSRIAGNIDSLELSKMVIQSAQQNEKDLKDQADKRTTIRKLASAPVNKIINCPYDKCNQPLEKALINIINASSPSCTNDTLKIVRNTDDNTALTDLAINEQQASASGIEMIFNQEDLNWEKAGDLFTPASKDMRDKYGYATSGNRAAANALKSSFTNLFDWQLIVDQDRPPLGESMTVNAYLVLPVGENVKDVNKALSIFWSEEAFFDMVSTNVIEDMTDKNGTSKEGAIPKYYTMKGAEYGISASQQINPEDVCKWEDIQVPDEDGSGYHIESVRTCTHYSFGFGFSDTASKNATSSKGQLLIPDFGLGFMVRKIQQKLRNTINSTYDYILSCQRVEDMFLGRCKGNPEGDMERSFCNGEGFKNIKNIPDSGSIPQFAKDTFTTSIAPKITDELIEAYEYAEKETGVPCEVAAGIHWTEGGLNANQSLFDGGSLRGGSLKEDAKQAMQKLIEQAWPGTFDKNNIEYEDLVAAIGAYNGLGNQNCAKDGTRWSEGGKCPPAFTSEDHPHPLGWIDDRHSDMDLIFCLDYVEFNCTAEPTEHIISELRSDLNQKQTEFGFSDARKEELITQAKSKCYANSDVCQSLGEGRKYPKYQRPGSITTAILLNESGTAQ